jgi:anion-transporting  ArsA/GET3 family ATPase
MSKRLDAKNLDVEALVADPATNVIVCCGSGGVGKTTLAAAIGLQAAESGRRVVVLTIDPAKRLAQSLGVDELDNTPRRVERVKGGTKGGTKTGPKKAGKGAEKGAERGELHAMMLDMKRTFDEIVEAHAAPARAAQILANPFYQSLSSSFAGTQEYMAMEKLGQLARSERWDLIVVDTPPSRSALEFLDAPARLARFLDGRFIRTLLVPARAGSRGYRAVMQAGLGMVTGAVTKILGSQLLTEVQTFVAAMDTMFGGLRERAEATAALLRAEGTAFVVVGAPEPDALREASYFVKRLAEERLPLAGVVMNRVHTSDAAGVGAARALSAAEAIEDDASASARLAAGVLRVHAARMRAAETERQRMGGFTLAHPTVPVAYVPAFAEDVHDLSALRAVATALCGAGGRTGQPTAE